MCPENNQEAAERVIPDEKYGKRRVVMKRIGIGAAIVLCLVSLALYLYCRTAPLYSLVPQDCAAMLVADTPWWWKSSEGIRANPAASSALGRMDKELGFSIKDDVMPWVGQISLVTFNPDEDEPRAALFAEIKNVYRFVRTTGRLRKSIERDRSLGWSNVTYRGVAIRRAYIPNPPSEPLRISFAIVKGWMVVGVGNGTVEQIIDTSQGSKKSLSQNEDIVRSLSGLSDNQHAAWMINTPQTGNVLDQFSVASHPLAKALRATDSVSIGALSGDVNDLQLKAVSTATSEKTRSRWTAFKRDIKPINGKILTQLPDGTSVLLLLSNPGKWFGQLEKLLFGKSNSDTVKTLPSPENGLLQGVSGFLNRFSGECAIAAAWKETTGFGIVAVGDAGDKNSALDAAKILKSMATSGGASMVEAGDLFEVAPEVRFNADVLCLPCWTARSNWLLIGSHPNWIKCSKTSVRLPKEAMNADAAFLVDLGFVPSFLQSRLQQSPYGTQGRVLDTVRKMNLNNACMTGWVKIDSEGRNQESVLELKGFDWTKIWNTVLMLETDPTQSGRQE